MTSVGRRSCFLFGLALLSGCRQNVDLDAVRQMSARAAGAQQSFDRVAQDFHDTCVRKLRWDYFKATARMLPPADLSTLGGLDASPYDSKRCNDAATVTAVARWQTFNRLYLGYFVALGSIAGGKSDANAGGMKAFATAVNRSGKFGNADDVSVSAALLGSAIDEYFSYRRRNALSQYAAADGTAFVEKTVPGLINASKILDNSLDQEEEAVNDFYVEGFKHGSGAGLASLLEYRHGWAADLAVVQQRRDAIVAYQLAVQELQASHESLVASIRNDDPQALSAVVQTYLTEFDPLVEKIDRAFK